MIMRQMEPTNIHVYSCTYVHAYMKLRPAYVRGSLALLASTFGPSVLPHVKGRRQLRERDTCVYSSVVHSIPETMQTFGCSSVRRCAPIVTMLDVPGSTVDHLCRNYVKRNARPCLILVQHVARISGKVVVCARASRRPRRMCPAACKTSS